MRWLLLSACAPTTTWLEGTWHLDQWTATYTADGSVLGEASMDDAGSIRFTGDGEMWSSMAYADLPRFRWSDGETTTFRRVSTTWWALWRESQLSPPSAIQLAWASNYAYGEILHYDRVDATSFTAVSESAFEPWPGPSGTLTSTWSFTRVEE